MPALTQSKTVKTTTQGQAKTQAPTSQSRPATAKKGFLGILMTALSAWGA